MIRRVTGTQAAQLLSREGTVGDRPGGEGASQWLIRRSTQPNAVTYSWLRVSGWWWLVTRTSTPADRASPRQTGRPGPPWLRHVGRLAGPGAAAAAHWLIRNLGSCFTAPQHGCYTMIATRMMTPGSYITKPWAGVPYSYLGSGHISGCYLALVKLRWWVIYQANLLYSRGCYSRGGYITLLVN